MDKEITSKKGIFSEEEMLSSLMRSGYLFESEITKRLSTLGFFVESNVTSLDPFTGKNREIDLLAEFDRDYSTKTEDDKTVAFARFVFEIKNNDAPLVLLTKHEYSPQSEIYYGLKIGETIPTELKNIIYTGFFDVLFNLQQKNLFTQYCSFSKKKNEELMAHHPEALYSALQKITYFCEEKAEYYTTLGEQYRDEYFRNFLYLPVLLLNDDLYELEIDEFNKNTLKKVDCSHLVFNYHYKQTPKTSIVHVVTKLGLEKFLKEIIETERIVEKYMIEAKRFRLDPDFRKQSLDDVF